MHDRLHRQQLQVHGGVELIEDHGFVEATGDRGPGDLPGPLRFHVVDRLLLAAPNDRIAAGAQVVDQVGIAFAQGGNGGVFGVAAAALEPLQDQHPVALVLADAAADRLQGLAQGAGGFALAFTGVNLNAIEPRVGGPIRVALLVEPEILAAVGPHFRVEIGDLHQLARRAPAGDDHFHAGGLGRQGLHHIGDVEQAQVQHRTQFIQHHHRIEGAGDRSLGDIPAPLGLLTIKFGGFVGREEIPAAGAHLVNQVGKALLQGLDCGVLVVGAAGTF